MKKIFKKLSGNFYLDGELYTNDLSFEEISGLSRKLEGGLTEEEEKKIDLIHYYVYDCFDLDNMELTFKERYAILKSLPKVKYVNIVETYNAKNKEEVREFQKKFVEEGYEGTMLRNYDSTYQLNKRTKDLQKYKDFMEDEFKIIGFTDGEGSEKGQVIWKCVTKDGKEFNVVPIGTRSHRKKLFKEAEKKIGKIKKALDQNHDKLIQLNQIKNTLNKKRAEQEQLEEQENNRDSDEANEETINE